MPDPAPPEEPHGDPSLRDLDRDAVLAALRGRIARLERAGAAAALAQGEAAVPLAPPIDAALPQGGLARAALHEVLAANAGAAAGFAALVLARARGTVLWIAAEPDAWPPGLMRFGLSPADLVLVQAPRPADGLWAMEEALRCPAVAGALLLGNGLDLTAARRLQLAAETGGGIGLLLRPDTAEPPPSAAVTRWRVGALPGSGSAPHDLGDPRWSLELLRSRGGRPGRWDAVWRAAAERLDVHAAERLDVEGAETREQDAAAAPRRRRAR